MDGYIDKNMKGMLASGKRYNSVRRVYYPDTFSVFVCNWESGVHWTKDVPCGIVVQKIGPLHLNVNARDSLIIQCTHPGKQGFWQLKFDDYVHGSTLDCWQLKGDLNVLINAIQDYPNSDFVVKHRFLG